jgi:hypothetical protein
MNGHTPGRRLINFGASPIIQDVMGAGKMIGKRLAVNTVTNDMITRVW